jgi:hypothetical protein
MKIALTGDVMLGRLVDEAVIRNTALPPETVWGDVLPFLFTIDRRLCNLECVISSKGTAWHPESKAFHFRAHPRAIDVLQAARVDCVTLANNHSLDYGVQALAECLSFLDRAGIRHAGAGLNLEAALAPALLTHATGSVAVIALTDNEPEWEARPAVPGINYIDYDSRGLVEPYRSRMKGMIDHARRLAQFLIVSAMSVPIGAPPRRPCRPSPTICSISAPISTGGIPTIRPKASNSTTARSFSIRRATLSTTMPWIRMRAMIFRFYSCSILIGCRCGRSDCIQLPSNASKFALREGRRAPCWNSACKPCVRSSGQRSSFKTDRE